MVSMGISGIHSFNVVVDIIFATSFYMIIVSRMVKQSFCGMNHWVGWWMNDVFMIRG